MLVLDFSNCDKCGGSLGALSTVQSANVICKKCNSQFKHCEKCKRSGCPKCGGKLLNGWEIFKHKTGQNVIF